MTPATIIKKAMAGGVNLALSPAGTIKVIGEAVTVNRWLPFIEEARGDDNGNRAALLSDVREYPAERWPCLIGYLNAEAAKYGATSGADDDDRRHWAECANLTSGGPCLAARRGVAKSRQA